MNHNTPAISYTSPATAQVKLCVAIQPSQTSILRGQSAQWVISAWTENGNVPEAIIRLVASPASVSPKFSFGCGSYDGTSSCNLGAVDAKSSARQLQAQVAVPALASVTSVKLTVLGSAAHLPADPQASATVPVKAATATGSTTSPTVTASPLAVGSLPYISASSSSTLSPGGNAAGLFPTLSPSPQPTPDKPAEQKADARTVANTSALPLGAPVVNAQLIGLGVLALAFVLAVTRLSIRRRPATSLPAEQEAGSAPSPGNDGPRDKDAPQA